MNNFDKDRQRRRTPWQGTLKRFFCSVLLAAALVANGQGDNAAEPGEPSAQPPSIGIADAVAGLNEKQQKALDIEAFWRRLAKTTVQWQGTVVEIKQLGEQRILYLRCPDMKAARDYNVIAYTAADAGLKRLEPGSELAFSGRVARYANQQGRPIVFVLKDVRIIPKTTPESGVPTAGDNE